MKGFGSDNHSGVHPILFQAMMEGNNDHQPSYGTDQYTHSAIQLFKNLFSENIDVHFVYNGTAANVLCLRAGLQRHESVLASNISHLHLDECGAPEFFAGKVIPLPSRNGKIIISEIEKYLIRKGDQHYSQPKMISITQPTELGTCYSIDEIKAISDIAQKHHLYLHVDGARICNAIYSLKTTFKKMLVETKVDLLSFGGTKNGFAFGEAVVILNSDLKPDFKYLKKQAAQLPSKSRFIALQFMAYLNNQLYLQIAENSVNSAYYLYEKLKSLSDRFTAIQITEEPQSNAVFVRIPQHFIKPLREKYFFYVWDESTFECRLMTSWDSTKMDIEGFTIELDKLLSQPT
jgi:threonine aldolase